VAGSATAEQRVEIYRLLGRIGPKARGAVEFLRAVLEDNDASSKEQEAAIQALGDIHPPANPTLMKDLDNLADHSTYPIVRARADRLRKNLGAQKPAR
jgi:hypothetical protein